MPLDLMCSLRWSTMFPLCTGAPKAVEVASPLTQTEQSITTTMELVTLRTRVSVRTSQVKMNQDMQGALANRSSVTLSAGMENVWSKLASYKEN